MAPAHVGEGIEGARARAAGNARNGIEAGDHEVMALLKALFISRDAALVAVEAHRGGALRDAGGVRRGLALNGAHGRHEILRASAVADSPAGHGIRLRDAVDGHGPVVQLRVRLGEAGEGLGAQ
jgi:hypothetical protein